MEEFVLRHPSLPQSSISQPQKRENNYYYSQEITCHTKTIIEGPKQTKNKNQIIHKNSWWQVKQNQIIHKSTIHNKHQITIHVNS